ncbi:MAG: very short patch repair endonuclease [Cyanobium sp.]
MGDDKPAVSEQRSRNMAAIRGKGTTPELKVRSLLHHLGYRFRLHRRDLPGTPDVVMPKHRTVIFVHGCFWHRHPGCRYATTPKNRSEFWALKFKVNSERDQRQQEQLKVLGWRVEIVWECELRDMVTLTDKLRKIDQAASMERG